MDDDKIINLIRIAIEVTEAKDEKIITPRSIQSAVRIMYMDEPELKLQLLTSGSTYCTLFSANNKLPISNLKWLNKLVREHLGSDIYDVNYKLGALSIPYLCGIIDKANGKEQY